MNIENASLFDIDSIMLLELAGFSADVQESRGVFVSRLEVFPEGFLVLKDKGVVVGYICSELVEYRDKVVKESFLLNHLPRCIGDELYISSMVILPEYRGFWLGSAMLVELMSRMRYRSYLLMVNSSWKAIGIYERLGFKEIDRFDGILIEDVIIMRKWNI